MNRHVQAAIRIASGTYRRRVVRRALAAGLPESLSRPLWYLAAERTTPAAAAAAERVEDIRAALAERDGRVPVYYSPRPHSAGEDTSVAARPDSGDEKEFTYRRIATHTSISPQGGGLLHHFASVAPAGVIVELGSCAGVAAAYMASAPSAPELITIEASRGLAEIAEEVTSQVSDRVRVVNAFFDDALDDLLPALTPGRVAMAWIDGHHERVATIHYFRRLIPTLAPGALVLFDDITWSQDMQDGWQVLRDWPGFSHTVDLGRLGLGVWAGGDAAPRHWDLHWAAGGPRRISNPDGWKS